MGISVTVGYLHGEYLSAFFHHSIMRLAQHPLIQNSIPMFTGPKLDGARNDVFKDWLTRTETTHMLMLDSDQDFGPNILDQLLSHDKDIVSGLYFTSPLTGEVAPIIRTFETVYDDDGNEVGAIIVPVWDYPLNSLIPVIGTGGGCLLVSRKAAMAVWEARGKDHPLPWFAYGVHNGVPIGEDIAFCLTALKCGFQPYCDTGAIVGHHKGIIVSDIDYVRSLAQDQHIYHDKREQVPVFQKYLGAIDGGDGS